MLKNKWFMAGILALALVFGFGLMGCDNGADGGGSSIPSELVGSWGVKSGSVSQQFLKINADGSGTWGPAAGGQDCSWSVSGDTLTLTLSGQSGSAKWSVSGGKLTLSSPGGGVIGTALVTADGVVKLD